MTLTELKSAVYQTAPEIGDFVNDETLARFFNECQRLLAFDFQQLKSAEVNVVDGVFTLPADCLVFKSATWNEHELSPWPGNSLPNIVTGHPAYYFQVGDSFYLIPCPQQNGTLRVFYITRPQDMQNESDTPFFPDCDEVLVAYALWHAYKVMGEDGQAKEWERIYRERHQLWFLNNRPRNYKRVRVNRVIV